MLIFKWLINTLHIVEGYSKWIFDILRGEASPRSIHRYKICKACESNVHGICSECGCIIKAKTRVSFDIDKDGKSIDGCPERKW